MTGIRTPTKKKFMIEEILGWDDIVNNRGETMVTYWPPKGDTFKTKWVR